RCGRDAVLGDGGIELAEGVADVGGGHEVAGDGGGEFRAEPVGFAELEFSASMERAEAGMAGVAKHAAASSVGERKFTERRFVDGVASAGREFGWGLGHGVLLGGRSPSAGRSEADGAVTKIRGAPWWFFRMCGKQRSYQKPAIGDQTVTRRSTGMERIGSS